MDIIIAIVGLGLLCLLFEIFNLRKGIVALAILGLSAILALNINAFGSEEIFYNNMIVVNKFSTGFGSLFILLTIFLVSISSDFYKDHQSKISDYIAIKIFLLAGAIMMISFGNLTMFFLGLEILSISLYILAASNRMNIKSNEAGLKYFLMGAFASAIILFGICFVYGALGTFDVLEIYKLSQSTFPIWFPVGIALIIIGMFFKIAIVPFHLWSPDVYEGSPSMTTATMSTLAKTAAVATAYKLLTSLVPNIPATLEIIIATLATASILVGNIMALKQTNVKRMLAFSGISHAGFMLMIFLNIQNSAGTLLYYAAAYTSAGIAAFSVIIFVCSNKDNEEITNFNGLGKTHSLLATILTAALLSMAGIPIFAGFFAKFTLFARTLEVGYISVVIIAIIGSIISVGYYFKLILAMYIKEPNEDKKPYAFMIYAVAIVAILINICLGLFPSFLLNLI